ncbi:hypothetical protein ACL6C3_18100 [Capilliphycus salinus ALCB114379]|uniref:hypothetical protein n=1 Tax=Capilliphycus salinus TaxID=2768948 RepID=UPI0039A45293
MYQPKCNREEIHDYLLDFKSKIAKNYIFKTLQIHSLKDVNRSPHEIEPEITLTPEEMFSTATEIAEIYGLEFAPDWRKKYNIWLLSESIEYLLSVKHEDSHN